jgi:hypothetical protein
MTTLQYTGTLLHHAHTATTVLDADGHTVPILCFEVELHNSQRTIMSVQQCFQAQHHAQCQAAAHKLKKGSVVQVDVPPTSLRLVAHYAQSIHTLSIPPVVHKQRADAPKTEATAEPELSF